MIWRRCAEHKGKLRRGSVPARRMGGLNRPAPGPARIDPRSRAAPAGRRGPGCRRWAAAAAAPETATAGSRLPRRTRTRARAPSPHAARGTRSPARPRPRASQATAAAGSAEARTACPVGSGRAGPVKSGRARATASVAPVPPHGTRRILHASVTRRRVLTGSHPSAMPGPHPSARGEGRGARPAVRQPCPDRALRPGPARVRVGGARGATGVVFDEDAEEALDAAEDGPVDHDGLRAARRAARRHGHTTGRRAAAWIHTQFPPQPLLPRPVSTHRPT